MEDSNKSIGIGIDIGSSSARIGLFSYDDGKLLCTAEEPVKYYYNPDSDLWKYTQRSSEVMQAIYNAFDQLGVDQKYVKSCGVATTCSMVVQYHGSSSKSNHNDNANDNDIVFWMDSTASKEAEDLNSICNSYLLDHLGGSFVPEMSIPKLKRLIRHLSEDQLSAVEVYDLHRYVALQIGEKYGWDTSLLCNKATSNGIGHDGELSGWAEVSYKQFFSFYYTPRLIGPSRRVLTSSPIKIASCIDCYASWYACMLKNKLSSLFMVAGTSTCYLFTSINSNHKTITGIWGPFYDLVCSTDTFAAYEAGQSSTGKLIEHLLQTHPASISSSLDSNQLLDKIHYNIERLEHEHKQSIHFLIRHCFFYGDYEGNRTPFADSDMSGMFIGHNFDNSFNDLTFKYVAILEFLSFQVKLVIETINTQYEYKVPSLTICGSQAKNTRFLQLISILNKNIPILIPKDMVSNMGIKGAYLLGKAATEGICLVSTLDQNDMKNFTAFRDYELSYYDCYKVSQLLETKYRIHLDMAKRQQLYRSMVNEICAGSIQ